MPVVFPPEVLPVFFIMTTTELKEAKRNLEYEILQRLELFMVETGMQTVECKLNLIDASTLCGPYSKVLSSVEIKLS